MKQKVVDFIKKYYVVILLALCFLLGFSVSDNYGAYWDQEIERDILLSNVRSYSLEIDALYDYTEYYFWAFPNAVPIQQSVEIDHGVAPYLGMFPIIMQHGSDMNAYNAIQHSYTFVIFFLGVLAVYYLGREITKSKNYGLLISMLYFTAPRFFAEGHYNNKDMVLLSFMLMTYALGYACIKKPKIWRCILFALAGAFAINVKIVGFLAVGIAGLLFILSIFKQEERKRRVERIWKSGFVFALFLVFYYLITPAMWGNIGGYFAYLIANAVQFSRWDGLILFAGEIYQHSTTGLPSFYLFAQYFLTTPILITLLALAGMAYMFNHAFAKNKRKEFWADSANQMIFLTSIISFLLMAYAALSGAVVYNSWRHFYFSFAGVLFLLMFLFKKIKEDGIFIPKGKQVSIAVFTLYFLVIVGGMVINHPYQFAYFNILAGSDVQERYEIDYWCVSYASALSELTEIVPEEEIMQVMTVDYVSGQPVYTNVATLPKEEQKRYEVVFPDVSNLRRGMYIVENMTYSGMHQAAEYDKIAEYGELMYEVEAYGNVLTRVYKY